MLFASAIIPTKGPDIALSAFARLKTGSASLTICGHSPHYELDHEYSKKLATRAKSISGVNWLGAVNHNEINELLSCHDLLVLPSTWQENSPLIVREATAAGLRIIASDAGGISELAPNAVFTAAGSEADLFCAMSAQVEIGRGRVPCSQWQTADEHASWLKEHAY